MELGESSLSWLQAKGEALAAAAIWSPRPQAVAQVASLGDQGEASAASDPSMAAKAPPRRYPSPPDPPTRATKSRLPAGTGDSGPLPAEMATSDIILSLGFNLVSLPNIPADASPAALLAPIAGQLREVFAYDHCDSADPWKLYDPTDPAASDLTSLAITQGVWIDVAAPSLLPVPGSLNNRVHR